MKLRLTQNFVYLLILGLLPAVAFAETVRIITTNAPFFYESRAAIKTPDNKLAELMSRDYKYAKDEFTKHDLFQQIKPLMDKRIREAKKTKKIFVRIGGKLGNYDFDKNAFTTGFDKATFVNFGNGYAVTFINGEQLKMLPVPLNSAKTLSGALRKDRRANYTIYAKIVGAMEQKFNRRGRKKTINVKITQIEVTLQNGTKVGTKTL